MPWTRREVVVIGGGAAGVGTALELAENGWKVTLIEKNKLLSGTSGRTPGRMGLGFHYADFETSVMLMRATIRFTKRFQRFRMGESLDWEHPLRHGRYFVAKDSLFNVSEILALYQGLKNEYSKMVANDPSNMVYGPPQNFYRVLSPEEYHKDVDADSVVLGVETSEHLLDCEKFSKFMVELVKNDKNITVVEQSEVINVEQSKNQKGRYTIIFMSHGVKRNCITTDYVVNSTFHEIEKINSLGGFHHMSESRTNRLKVLLEVRLPDAMLSAHSMFFCIGPFCMFSNLGNGWALITYAPVTNVETSTAVSISKKMDRLLTDGPREDEYQYYSENILQGASRYIPGLKHAKIIGLRFGIVQTRGMVDIYDNESPFHKRDYFGVRAEGPGWVSNPCMKLLYLLENANIATDILGKHFQQDHREP